MEIKKYIRDGRAPIPEREITSKTMSSIKAKNTKPEIALRKALWESMVKGYRLHWKKAPGKPDIAFPGRKVAVFINGCFWHRCPYCNPSFPKTHIDFWNTKFTRNAERDQQKNKELEALGWKTITIWECQIKGDIGSCVKTIKKEVDPH